MHPTHSCAALVPAPPSFPSGSRNYAGGAFYTSNTAFPSWTSTSAFSRAPSPSTRVREKEGVFKLAEVIGEDAQWPAHAFGEQEALRTAAAANAKLAADPDEVRARAKA